MLQRMEDMDSYMSIIDEMIEDENKIVRLKNLYFFYVIEVY